jgi:hypothetical protein
MFSTNNLNKPDHKLLKQIADIALYTLPLYVTVVLGMPISDNTQKWIIVGLNTTVVIFKAITKFTTDEKVPVTNSDFTTDL